MLKYHIQTIELSSAAESIEFTSIPQYFTDLVLVASWRHSRSAVDGDAKIEFNRVTNGYSNRVLYGNGSGTSSFSQSQILLLGSAGSSTANVFSNNLAYISNYTSLANKSVNLDLVTENNSASVSLGIEAATWANTAPITSIRITAISGNIVANSSFSLYGIKSGSDKVTQIASGGVVSTSGAYTIHTFNTSGTFVANRDLTVEYVVVAGGGGGGNPSGNYYAAGGGAGGFRASTPTTLSGGNSSPETPIALSEGNYAVTVGAGGGATANGGNSSFYTIVAVGGGGGASSVGQAGLAGGSGGGGQRVSQPGGAREINQGFIGGFGSSTSFVDDSGAGGGGGAGGPGEHLTSNAFTNEPGPPGPGLSSSISGTLAWYAEGGTGSGFYNRGGYYQQIGGNVSSTRGVNAAINTGSGGGGGKSGGQGPYSGSGGTGGSGVVIIRYLTP
jgi:hypothetical protein